MNLSEKTWNILFLFFAMLIGGLAGLGAIGFRAFVEFGQWLFWPQGVNFLERVINSPWWFKLLIPTLGGLAIGPVIAYWAPEIKGPGVPEVIEAVALQKGAIRPRVTILKPVFSGLIIATGGSVGREGPVVQIGSAIGSSLAQFFHFTPEKTRLCLACGAAAGIAATFNAPIAGTLFAVEIILTDVEVSYLSHIVLAAVVATVISRQFLGDFPAFMVTAFRFKHPAELLLYLVLGIGAGLLSVLLIKAIFGTDTLFQRLPVPDYLKPGIGGLLLGGVGLLCPYVFGVGYESINLTLNEKLTIMAVLLILGAKFLATVFSLGSGMSGGIFAPSLFLGSMLGTSLAVAADYLLPGVTLYPADYALVGMGALVSGTTLGPITAILTIFELTNTYRIIVPLMVSCIASLVTVRYLYGYSAYETKLLRKGVNIVRGHEVNLLRSLMVKDYMTKDLEILHDYTPLYEILRRAEESAYPYFVVLNAQGELSGVLTLWDLRQTLEWTLELSALVVAEELMTKEVVTLTPYDNFETAFNLFEGKNISFMPVVSPYDRKKVLGILRREDLLTAYNQRVLKYRLLQFPLRKKSG
ncbi:MAG: chloride channel protein [Desulfobacteraceae bacterium]